MHPLFRNAVSGMSSSLSVVALVVVFVIGAGNGDILAGEEENEER